MRRITAIFLAAVMLSAVSCDKKGEEKPAVNSPAVTTEANSTETTETTPEAAETAVIGTETETSAVTTSIFTEDFTFLENDPEFEEQLDNEVIIAAQALFETACETEWIFTVGSPYKLDTSEYVTNDYGWQYYLITDVEIDSFEDVLEDYYEVFSPDYKNSLDELYREQDGKVYCLNGARGSNIFYEGTEVTLITGRDDGEIRFNVVSTYSGGGEDNAPYTEENEFIIRRNDDGAWRVSEFKLPY